jgi:hypothetical protein
MRGPVGTELASCATVTGRLDGRISDAFLFVFQPKAILFLHFKQALKIKNIYKLA